MFICLGNTFPIRSGQLYYYVHILSVLDWLSAFQTEQTLEELF